MEDNNPQYTADGVDRRKILQTMAASGAVTLGVSGASAAENDDTFENGPSIVDAKLQAGDEVYPDLQTLMLQQESQKLVSFMEDNADVQADPTIFPLGLKLQTDDRSLNRRNPRLVALFSPSKKDVSGGSITTNDLNRGPSEVSYGLGANDRLRSDRMGMMYGLVLDASGNSRQPSQTRLESTGDRVVSSFAGITTKDLANSHKVSASANSTANTAVTYYGLNEGEPAPIDHRPFQLSHTEVSGGGASTEDGCWVNEGTCTDIVVVACAGTTTLDTGACLTAATSAGGLGGPAGAVAAYALCEALSTWAGGAVCATSADDVCDDIISDDCGGGGLWPF